MASNLVFLSQASVRSIPFTTSEIIAEHAKISHHAVRRIIAKHSANIEEFGKLAFEMRPLPRSKTGQSEKIYHLTDDNVTLVITCLQ